MLYTIKLRTDESKSSMEFGCNDFDIALKIFRSYVVTKWDILGNLEVTWIDENHKILYKLEKNY